jgi:multidrug efflux pump subunit AcrA (membrane-fusion protein)
MEGSRVIRQFLVPVAALLGVVSAIAMVEEGRRGTVVQQPRYQPAQAPYSSYIFGPGIVEAGTENIAVGTPVSGIVTAIYVKWGDQVRAGDPLFKVDTRDLEAQLPPAIARVKEVEASSAKAKNHLKIGEVLVPGVSISAEDLENRRSDVEIGEATLASARAQVRQIQDEMQLRTVRAPVSGSILQLTIRLGQFAPSGVLPTPLLLLGDDKLLHVRVDIDQSDAWRFRPDASAVAYVRGNSNLRAALRYVRTDPYIVPQALLTGDATQRTDTRVLQVIYGVDRTALPAYVGQLMDVFIEAPPLGSTSSGRK